MNTMLMAVFERTRELGMLMALGMRPAQVIGLIIAEAAGLACASLILGGAIHSASVVFANRGLDLGGKTGGVVTTPESSLAGSGMVGRIFPSMLKPLLG